MDGEVHEKSSIDERQWYTEGWEVMHSPLGWGSRPHLANSRRAGPPRHRTCELATCGAGLGIVRHLACAAALWCRGIHMRLAYSGSDAAGAAPARERV
jgi:hypothetical protein